MKVRISNISENKCNVNWWYNNLLNEEFEVRACNSLDNNDPLREYYSCLDFYRTDKGLILKADCTEIISNKSRVFFSGAKRDSDKDKPYCHNLQGYTRLRFGYLTRMGADKYGDQNFLLGMPKDQAIQSNDRHWAKYLMGDRTEDHLSAMIFNLQLIMLEEEKEGIKVDHYFKIIKDGNK